MTLHSSVAVLLVDLVNPFDFEGGDDLFPHAVAAARRIARLKRRARSVGVPVIYVNDNFGQWHMGFRELVAHVRHASERGAAVLDVLAPDPAVDHFVLKPRHSGFFLTGLECLLAQCGASTLVITGVATEICVLFTANDAHMRGYRIIVPADCVASQRLEDHAHALGLMQRSLRADVAPEDDVVLDPTP